MNNLNLKQHPTLPDLQEYVKSMVKARGFDKETVPESFLLFLEECGELAKAARKATNMTVDAKSKVFDVGHEAADVFWFLLVICNHFKINLDKAFREKEEINKKRTWK